MYPWHSIPGKSKASVESFHRIFQPLNFIKGSRVVNRSPVLRSASDAAPPPLSAGLRRSVPAVIFWNSNEPAIPYDKPMRDCQSKAPAGGSEAQVGITERNHDGVERSIMGSRGERMLNGAMDNARRARPSVRRFQAVVRRFESHRGPKGAASRNCKLGYSFWGFGAGL